MEKIVKVDGHELYVARTAVSKVAEISHTPHSRMAQSRYNCIH